MEDELKSLAILIKIPVPDDRLQSRCKLYEQIFGGNPLYGRCVAATVSPGENTQKISQELLDLCDEIRNATCEEKLGVFKKLYSIFSPVYAGGLICHEMGNI